MVGTANYVPDKSRTYHSHGQFLAELINHLGFARIAEIGVCHGDVAERILAGCPWVTDYYLVDPWEEYPERQRTLAPLSHWSQDQWNRVFEEVLKKMEPYNDRAHILRMASAEAAESVENEFFDMVYIDALHEYKPVLADICAWLPRVKPTGILAGHDWWDNRSEYAKKLAGVMQALLTLFERKNIHTGNPSANWDHVWLVWKSDIEGVTR